MSKQYYYVGMLRLNRSELFIEAHNRSIVNGSPHQLKRRLSKELPDLNWLRRKNHRSTNYRKLITVYMGMGYVEINTRLRAHPLIDAPLNRYIYATPPLHRPIVVYRLLFMPTFRGTLDSELLLSAYMGEISITGYISTSIALTPLIKQGEYTLLRMEVPPGTHCLWLGGPEKEILFPHQTQCKIISRHYGEFLTKSATTITMPVINLEIIKRQKGCVNHESQCL